MMIRHLGEESKVNHALRMPHFSTAPTTDIGLIHDCCSGLDAKSES
jgi:hypothetical protein